MFAFMAQGNARLPIVKDNIAAICYYLLLFKIKCGFPPFFLLVITLIGVYPR